MAVTLTLETGSGISGANTYVSLAQAETYMEGRLASTAWDAATDDSKNRALVTAVKTMDARLRYVGTIVDDQQAMQWPREGIYYEGHEWPDNTIPAQVKDAQVEFAVNLITNGDRSGDPGGEGVKSLNVGKGAVELEFDQNTKPDIIPDVVFDFLGKWIVSSGSGTGIIATVRV